MLTEELGLNLEIIGSPLKSALVMFGSFLLGGILPNLPHFVVKFWTHAIDDGYCSSNFDKYCFLFHSRRRPV